jgi:hypothetical protein
MPLRKVNLAKRERYLLIIDLEVDVQSVEHPGVLEVADDVLDHLGVIIALFGAIVSGFPAHLDPGRIKRHVLILERGYQDDVLEVLETRRA